MYNLQNNRKQVFFHIVYWVSIVLFFTFSWGTRYNNYWVCFYNEVVFLPIRMGVVYFGLYYVIPKLLLKRKYFRFAVAFVAMMAVGSIMQRTLVYYSSIPLLGFRNPDVSFFDTTELLHYVISINAVMIIPFAVKLYSYSLEKENRILSLSHEKSQAELQFLRSQIQPHFFFNVLNDLYAMALKHSEKTPEMIMKLSDLMRYVLHESTAESVPVEKELNYIRNYIDLEKLRYGSRFSVDLQVKGGTKNCQIAPLLLFPFVENAFKHSTTNETSGAWISIELMVNADEVCLLVSNSFDPEAKRESNVSSGIGIKNVRDRLDILYPGRYVFDTKVIDQSYVSSLKIKLPQ
jgi:sensor histidine kinase YesM